MRRRSRIGSAPGHVLAVDEDAARRSARSAGSPCASWWSCRSRRARSARRSCRSGYRGRAGPPRAATRREDRCVTPSSRIMTAPHERRRAPLDPGEDELGRDREQPRPRAPPTISCGMSRTPMPAVISSPSPPPPMKAASVAADDDLHRRGADAGEDHRQRERDLDAPHDLGVRVMPWPRAASTMSAVDPAQARIGVDQDRRQAVERQRDDRRDEAGAEKRQHDDQQREARDRAQHVHAGDRRIGAPARSG